MQGSGKASQNLQRTWRCWRLHAAILYTHMVALVSMLNAVPLQGLTMLCKLKSCYISHMSRSPSLRARAVECSEVAHMPCADQPSHVCSSVLPNAASTMFAVRLTQTHPGKALHACMHANSMSECDSTCSRHFVITFISSSVQAQIVIHQLL